MTTISSQLSTFFTSRLKYFSYIRYDKGCGYLISDNLLSKLPYSDFNKGGWLYGKIMRSGEKFDLDTFIKYLKESVDDMICGSYSRLRELTIPENKLSETRKAYTTLREQASDEDVKKAKERIYKYIDKNAEKYEACLPCFDIYSASKSTSSRINFYAEYLYESGTIDLKEDDSLSEEDQIKKLRELLNLVYEYKGDIVFDALNDDLRLEVKEKKFLPANNSVFSDVKNTEIQDWLKANNGICKRTKFPATSSVYGGNFSEYYYYGVILKVGNIDFSTVVCTSRFNDFGGWN
jgi:hypothetical protein